MLHEEKFTPATFNDVVELEKLVNKAYRGDESKKGWTTEADLLDGIRTDKESLVDMMQRPGAVILKYEEDGELLGCVFLYKIDQELYLGMLTVLPTAQGKGIGKKLVAASEQYAKNASCRFVTMTVISVRSELIDWYKRRGYSVTGEKKPFPNDVRFGIPKQPLEFVVMKKRID